MRGKLQIIGAVLALLVGLAGGLRAAQVEVIGQGPDYLRLVYRADGPDDPESLSGRTWLVGLPAAGTATLTLLEVQGRPTAAPWAVDETVGERRTGPAVLGAEGWLRGQRVVELTFAPRWLDEAQVEVFDRVVVEVRFSSPGGQLVGQADRWGEELLRGSLLNYQQARGWRQSRPRRVARMSAAAEVLVRVVVREEGMYRISGAELQAAGVDLSRVDPSRLRLLYGGGQPLPLDRYTPPVERRELPLLVETAAEGPLAADDFVLFYGEPASRWEYDETSGRYRYLRNLYTHDNVYWLAIGGSQERQAPEVRSGALEVEAAQVRSGYRVRVHEEFEQFIMRQTYNIRSGYEWYWEEFRGNARNYPQLIRQGLDQPLVLRLCLWGVSTAGARFTVKWNDLEVGEVGVPGVGRTVREVVVDGGLREGLNHLGLVHRGPATARLDWYQLEYSRQLVAGAGALFFDAPAAEGVTQFELSGFAGERPRLFAVSGGLAEIVEFEHDPQTGELRFQDRVETPSRYAAVVPSRWRRPAGLSVVAPEPLTAGPGAEYLIITHADFGAAAERLAGWRARDDRFGPPLSSQVVDVQAIYDQFSGGQLDPAAIRNFLRYAAQYWETPPFFMVLLGDGTYDYKNNSGTSPGNWIPAYQDDDSTYDEWYVQLADESVLPGMAIGRLPVQTAAEAARVVDKLIAYDREPEVGPWQSRMLLVADDVSNPEHPERVESEFLLDAEVMATHFLPEDLHLRKLYLAQYPLEGRTKPRAQAEFLRRLNEGVLLLTYLGHGNPDVLAHEHVFVVSRDLDQVNNGRRLPFVYTAASQVGVFDDPLRRSMPEALLLRAGGGAIGMICATRVGYHTSNMLLANAFHRQLHRSGREHVPLGLALLEAKQQVQVFTSGLARINIRRYSLFGDPATRLARPRWGVELSVADSLRALEEVPVDGQVVDEAGRPAAGFTGQVWVEAFDSSSRSRLDGLPYEQLGAPLFRGLFPVQEGRFSARFRVPKDITYRGVDGRVSAYAWAAGQPTAFGAVRGRVLAGTAEGVEVDRQGPQIELGFVGVEGWVDGGRVPPQAVLRARLRDPSGINITGETGHEIELMVNRQVIVVTEHFYVEGDYREGILEYPLPALEPGTHSIRLKAWDSFNNSSQAEIQVEVSERDEVVLADLLFHPSPLRGEEGHFTFTLALPAQWAHLRIFALSGRLVDQVQGPVAQGFNQLSWRPAPGLANGAYLYQLEVEREDHRPIVRTAVIQLAR